MKSTFATFAGAFLLVWFACGCSESPVAFPLRSLEVSGETSFVCVGSGGEGYDINACPDFDSVENPRHLLALVTQTRRGEVAVVDLSLGKVLDLDTSTPGFGFMPVGANPGDIVSTPGGVASFVGVGEPGKEGIFALPSSCARPPAHDLTAWSACSLDVAPGDMAIVIDPPVDDDGDPLTPPLQRASCDLPPSADASVPGAALAATREDCPADLALETSPEGRRKLLVTLPQQGVYGFIDAQSLLDREPGSFQPCEFENNLLYPLQVDLPASGITQKIPADLQSECTPPELQYGPQSDTFQSEPAGIAINDGRMFVADRGAPVVHVIDIHDPCQPLEQPSLLPLSFDAPSRTVTTKKVAVSPPTTDGQQFAYAIEDDFDGSVMMFNATPGNSDRTPIVRSGSPRMPFEPPDRIRFDSPARDLTFALRDVPAADPETGVVTIGSYCDPAGDSGSVGAKYRPNGDFSKGARAHNLRGVFGFVMLASGQVAVVDVEDFDAPCRRPIQANSAGIPDFRGCLGDPTSPEFYTQTGLADGKRTVSNEVSCNIFEQHRARSGRVMINSSDFGVNAPALRGFPRLASPDGGNLSNDQTAEGNTRPRLLAVDYPDPADPDPVDSGRGVRGRGAVPNGRFRAQSDGQRSDDGRALLPELDPERAAGVFGRRGRTADLRRQGRRESIGGAAPASRGRTFGARGRGRCFLRSRCGGFRAHA